MRTRRDFLTPAIVISGIILVIFALWVVICDAQTHTMPGSNVVPSGASLTINSGASITAAAGSTVTGFGSGGGGAPTTATYITQTTDSGLSAEVALSSLATGLLKSTTTTGALTTITDNSTNWNTAFTQTRQWDGGSTGLVAATGRTSLALVVGTNVQAWDTDLDTWATLTPSANFQTMVPHTFSQMRTDLSLVPGTNVEVPLTFSTGLTRSTNTVTVNTSQNIATLSNLTTNGFVKTGGAIGTLSVDTGTYVTSSATGMQTWLTTPSSANLRGTLTDENGTGAALFSGATTPDFTTGFTIGAAAGSGKVMKGNGTNFVPSTETYAAPGTSGNVFTSDGTNWTSAAPVVTASNTLTFTNKRITPRVTSTASATTWAPSADTDDVYEITGQTAPVTTISNPAGTPVDGQSLIIRFSDNGTARALSWTGSQWQAGPGLALPTTTIVGNHDYVGFKWNSTTSKWTMVASTQLTGMTDDTAYGSSWNAVTGLSPSKNAVYDELHLIDTADNGTIVNAGTGFTIAGAAGSGKILQANGTNFVASTATWPTTNTAGYTVRGDGTNYAVYPQDMLNSSVSSQSPSTSDVYVAGSNVVVAAGDFKVKGQYRCLFDVTKSAGTGGIVISVRAGTAGTTGDTAQLTFTFPAGTSVADVGTFEVFVNWRTIGSGTSAVIEGVCRAQKNTVTAAGLWGDTSAAKVIVATVSSGFASNTFTNIGCSFNGGTAFAGTVTTVQASLLQ